MHRLELMIEHLVEILDWLDDLGRDVSFPAKLLELSHQRHVHVLAAG